MATRTRKTLDEVAAEPGVTGEQAEQERKLAGLKLANNQLVKRSGDGFDVFTDDGKFHVSKDGDKTVCPCDDFKGADAIGVTATDKTQYACVHIYAVRAATTDTEFGKEEMETVQAREETPAEEVPISESLEQQNGENGERPPSVVEVMSRPLTKAMIKTRDVSWGKGYVEYVEWHTVCRALNKTFGDNWDYHVTDLKLGQGSVAAVVALTIVGPNGPVTRYNVGVGSFSSPQQEEMAIKGAVSDGLKRAAALFGFALELYEDDDTTGEPQQSRPASFRGNTQSNSQASNASPVARNLGDMVTAKQLNMIRALGREKNVDPETVCGEMFACRIEEISKRAASDLIDRLQSSQPGMPVRDINDDTPAPSQGTTW